MDLGQNGVIGLQTELKENPARGAGQSRAASKSERPDGLAGGADSGTDSIPARGSAPRLVGQPTPPAYSKLRRSLMILLTDAVMLVVATGVALLASTPSAPAALAAYPPAVLLLLAATRR